QLHLTLTSPRATLHYPVSLHDALPILATLQCSAGEIQLGDALQLLARPAPRRFDIVLLDPPFHKDLLQSACTLLETQVWLADDRSEEHTSELQSRENLVCRLLLEKKNS